MAIASRLGASESAAATLARDIAGAVESLQKQNRRILANLRPAAPVLLNMNVYMQTLIGDAGSTGGISHTPGLTFKICQ